jgi:hypothetical protein
MIRIRDFDQDQILLWWSEAPKFGETRFGRVARIGKAYQIDERDLQESRLRQRIPKLLQKRRYLPRNRAPNNQDYDLAAEQFLDQWYNQEAN